MRFWIIRVCMGVASISQSAIHAQTPLGYYRQPALHESTLIFVAEGDLWKAPAAGGVATRLTSHPGSEERPQISPDGAKVAFAAEYEGPTEIYVMPISGGLPRRCTYSGGRNAPVGWTADGKIIASTDAYSTLPDTQLALLDVRNANAAPGRTMLPLAQAADGAYADDGQTLFFTRLPFQGSHTRRYKGGTAQNIWRFAANDAEAQPLTADYAGTSRRPMFWSGRVYFASDRDGLMNLWSMKPDGSDLKQHTRHKDYEVLTPSLGQGRIVYQHGADIRLYDIQADRDGPIRITLDSDFDQTRERWVAKPMDYLSAAHLSPDGTRVVLTARGNAFVAPQRQGRLVEIARRGTARLRDARFMPDGQSLIALSDESGEVELWMYPASGVGSATQLTTDGSVLRWEAEPSPDGKWIAYHDKNQRLFLLDVEKRSSKQIDSSDVDSFQELRWSPDSRYLAYVASAPNQFKVIRIHCLSDGVNLPATSDRYDSFSPTWSTDGKWLYFLSDRNLTSAVSSPWGNYQPEPFLDKRTQIYALALIEGLRFPFAPANELDDAPPANTPTSAPNAATAPTAASSASEKEKDKDKEKTPVAVKIDSAGLESRLFEAPIPPGNYQSLSLSDKALFWLSSPTDGKQSLAAANIARENVEVKTVLADIRRYELSADRKRLLLQKSDGLYIVDAAAEEAKLDKKDVNLAGWSLAITPREEWARMFADAWRLHRDYFYDTKMHGVDWAAMRAKYEPLVQRVATRDELSDLIAQLVAEVSALHTFVSGGDTREGPDQIGVGFLGAELARDEAKGGYRIERIYQSDPDEPEKLAPLSRPSVRAKQGDVIVEIDGSPAIAAPDAAALLRGKIGKQVRLKIQPADGGEPRNVIVMPLDRSAAADLRYRDWELARRMTVERDSAGQIGYVHLRAMGNANFTEWARAFYPVFTRQGLIVDVRHNRGGNIDSWILGRLLRKAWMGWSQRVGQAPTWNMQFAFRGHLVVLCDEYTASDGEAFTEGFRRLGLGKIIGARTWGGEIWLTSSNRLVDGGVATAAEFGVYGPEGQWLIEGHGVEPDVKVDNLPHATFMGKDAQLEAAIAHLQQLIREKPIDPLRPPRHPDKSK